MSIFCVVIVAACLFLTFLKGRGHKFGNFERDKWASILSKQLCFKQRVLMRQKLFSIMITSIRRRVITSAYSWRVSELYHPAFSNSTSLIKSYVSMKSYYPSLSHVIWSVWPLRQVTSALTEQPFFICTLTSILSLKKWVLTSIPFDVRRKAC